MWLVIYSITRDFAENRKWSHGRYAPFGNGVSQKNSERNEVRKKASIYPKHNFRLKGSFVKQNISYQYAYIKYEEAYISYGEAYIKYNKAYVSYLTYNRNT